MSADLGPLEGALGHTFRDRELLERALTHKSHAYENPAAAAESAKDNERLEFLGDSILGFVVSDCLVRRHADFPEGPLSQSKAHLVSTAHLYQVAQQLGLGEFLFLGRGEERTGGREKKALLANAVEALIAALYLDAGMDVARAFIEARVMGAPEDQTGSEGSPTDYKSALQEMAQALKLPQPRYRIASQSGPDHAKTFTVEVSVGESWISSAEGLSKKSAGQEAAKQVLQQLSEWGR